MNVSERNEAILADYRRGTSLADLGRHHNISRERVRQVVKAAGESMPEERLCAVCGVARATPVGEIYLCVRHALNLKRTGDPRSGRRAPAPAHGTRSGYEGGCKCDPCMEANREYGRLRYRRMAGKAPPSHGISGYRNYACHCPVCTAANREQSRIYRESVRLARDAARAVDQDTGTVVQ